MKIRTALIVLAAVVTIVLCIASLAVHNREPYKGMRPALALGAKETVLVNFHNPNKYPLRVEMVGPEYPRWIEGYTVLAPAQGMNAPGLSATASKDLIDDRPVMAR